MRTILGYLDILADFYESPVAGSRAVVERSPVGLGVLCFLFSGATLTVANALKGGGGSAWMFKLLPWGAVLVVAGLLPLVTGFLAAGVFHLTAEMLGAKRGSAAGLFVLLGISQALYILYLPVVLTTQVLTDNPGLWRAAAIAGLAVASISLKIAGIRVNYGFSVGRAGAVLVLPIAAALVLAAGAVGTMVGGLMQIGKLFQ